jgi:hypothetical protein
MPNQTQERGIASDNQPERQLDRAASGGSQTRHDGGFYEEIEIGFDDIEFVDDEAPRDIRR